MPSTIATPEPPDATDEQRRKLLISITGVALGASAVAASVPFVASLAPSERARALGGPVEADLAGIAPGQMQTIEWRGSPVWILRRSPQMLDRLGKKDNSLRDPASEQPQQPEYCKNETRSIKPEFLVTVGLCTHLQCIPNFFPETGSIDADWQGGFYCPCHGSKFDFAGRVFKGVPAPTNLVIPPHGYLSEDRVLIGVEKT